MKEKETKRVIKKTLPDGRVVRTVVIKKEKTEKGENKEEAKPKPKPKRERKKKSKKGRIGTIWLLLINGFIIALLAGGGLIAAHYLLQRGTRHGARAVVPDFQSLTMDQAQRLAKEGDLRLIINDSTYAPTRMRGSILDQVPQEGTIVKPGRTIYLTINATQQKMVDVPYVAGRSLRQAMNMLEMASLSIEELIYEEDIATNYILAQYCNGKEISESSDAIAPVGTGVTLRVGVDEAHNEVVIPSLRGKTFQMAQNTLWSAGLNVGEVVDMEGETQEITPLERRESFVIFQNIPSDSLVRMGTRLDLELSLHRSSIDSAIVRERREAEALEALALREKEIADSLAHFAVDSLDMEFVDIMPEVEVEPEVEEKPQVVVERVEMEDLFN